MCKVGSNAKNVHSVAEERVQRRKIFVSGLVCISANYCTACNIHGARFSDRCMSILRRTNRRRRIFPSRKGHRYSLCPALVVPCPSYFVRTVTSPFHALHIDHTALSSACATGVDKTRPCKSTLSALGSYPARLGMTHLFSRARRLLAALTCLGSKFALKKSDARHWPERSWSSRSIRCHKSTYVVGI